MKNVLLFQSSFAECSFSDVPDDIVALAAHWGARTSWDVLSTLYQRVEVLRMWPRGGAVWSFWSRIGDFAK